jgi:hypothetical protein
MDVLRILTTKIAKPTLIIVAACVIATFNSGFVIAQMTPEQRRTIQSGARYFNVEETTSTGNECVTPGSVGAPSISDDQLMAFASLPLTATWNISDTTAEQWFLKQTGARPTITRYGLNESNIGAITSIVKGIGVSPVFFYAYAANEGGGEGGFINHYSNEASGGGAGNARRDAEYLVNQSNTMNSIPAWVDVGRASRRAGGGSPVDFVPQDVKDSGNAHFQGIPAGTIGRAYIPATAATTWEVYFPDGLKKEFNLVQNYGRPLADTMRHIETMGGNPTEGGTTMRGGVTTGSCPPGGTANENVSEPGFEKNPEVQVDGSPSGAHKASNCTGSFTVGAASLKEVIAGKWMPPVTSIGGYSCRAIVGGSSTSIHGLGRALDVMVDANTPEGLAKGNEIRNWVINNATQLGVQRVIWNKYSWAANRDGWNLYYKPGENNPHTDHLHIEINVAASNNPNLGK